MRKPKVGDKVNYFTPLDPANPSAKRGPYQAIITAVIDDGHVDLRILDEIAGEDRDRRIKLQ